MSLVLSYLALVGAYVAGHPAEVVMLVGAICSVLQSKLSAKWPALGKLCVMAAHAGVNLVALKQTFVQGSPAVIEAAVAKAEAAVAASAPAVK